MKILCCGDRRWNNKDRIKEILQGYPKETIIIQGEASGADTLCKEVAEELGMTVIPVPANWKKYQHLAVNGRKNPAGPIRNKEMLDMMPDEVLAFHNDIKNSKGTKNCITQARQRGIRVLVLTEKK